MELDEFAGWLHKVWGNLPKYLQTIIKVVLILTGPAGWIAWIICAVIMHQKPEGG